MLESPAEVIKLTLLELEKKYGSVNNYFKTIGLEQALISNLCDRLSGKI